MTALKYPAIAGYKGISETGINGAAHINPTLGKRQTECLQTLEQLGEASADEVAKIIGRHWFHVRPRFSELKALGEVQETGRKVETGLGGHTIVYRVSTPIERAIHAARRAANREHGDSQ